MGTEADKIADLERQLADAKEDTGLLDWIEKGQGECTTVTTVEFSTVRNTWIVIQWRERLVGWELSDCPFYEDPSYVAVERHTLREALRAAKRGERGGLSMKELGSRGRNKEARLI